MADVRLDPWGEGDLPLLRRILGDPAMTEHLGGPESEERLVTVMALCTAPTAMTSEKASKIRVRMDIGDPSVGKDG